MERGCSGGRAMVARGPMVATILLRRPIAVRVKCSLLRFWNHPTLAGCLSTEGTEAGNDRDSLCGT